MIQELWIKNIATYNDVGIHITDLKKINFIYGANGCGKTTITKFVEAPLAPTFSHCGIQWKNATPLRPLVYNKDFRDRNFGKGSMNGVFTLGEATIDQIGAIKLLEEELESVKQTNQGRKDSLDKLKKERDDLEEVFREKIWIDIYKKNEKEFKEAFVGVLRKVDFSAKSIDEFTKNKEPLKTIKELKEKSATIFGKIPISIPLLSNITFSKIKEIESDPIWQKKIIGKADVEISLLIQRLNMNDWVNEGRAYLQENEICPFCQKDTITKTFRKQLEEYFDESFIKDTTLVKKLSEEYITLSNNLNNFLDGIEKNEKANTGTKLKLDIFSALLKTAASQFVTNRELLYAKVKEPSRSIQLFATELNLSLVHQELAGANAAIGAHNLIVTNYTTERAQLIKNIWRYLTEENKISLQDHINKTGNYQKGIIALEKQHQDLSLKHSALKKQIQDANRNVTSIKPSVDAINRTLASYGFLNFEIVESTVEKNKYQIHREDGTIADTTLSEGEITFITFLYFIQLARGGVSQDAVSEERILLIDDPVSSLDSNVLFVVSSIIKKIIAEIKKNEGKIKQLILLTHNVYFHKEVSFINGGHIEQKDTHFWVLRRNKNVSSVQGYGMKNPISSTYELLWRELKNQDKLSGVTTQNIMRRIIENYFKMMGKYGDDQLIATFESHEEQEICRSLICWINDGSHSIGDDLFIEHQDSTVQKYNDVFRAIFEKTGHDGHYRMMMGDFI